MKCVPLGHRRDRRETGGRREQHGAIAKTSLAIDRWAEIVGANERKKSRRKEREAEEERGGTELPPCECAPVSPPPTTGVRHLAFQKNPYRRFSAAQKTAVLRFLLFIFFFKFCVRAAYLHMFVVLWNCFWGLVNSGFLFKRKSRLQRVMQEHDSPKAGCSVALWGDLCKIRH